MDNLLTRLLDSLLVATNNGVGISSWNLTQIEYELLITQIREYGLFDEGINDEDHLAGIKILVTN